MTDRLELLEASLDILPEGIALADANGCISFWSITAEAITGYPRATLLGRPVGEALETLIVGGARQWSAHAGAHSHPSTGTLMPLRHRLGHQLPAIVRVMVLRNGLGERIGNMVVFHPAHSLDALPHGATAENEDLNENLTDLDERLQREFEDFTQGAPPFGVLWLTVDQAQSLRKTHGPQACDAMFGKVERALAGGLRPTDQLGRWGDDEFLVLSHERTAEMLAAHARTIAGLARTADFRWWGDRLSLTVSIGAAQADPSETLAQLLERAQTAMHTSLHAGGNQITSASGRVSCSPS
ncbi:MAG: diguanylate cyclase [Terracidiphilus sp.]|jgi:diguanylate cyclase (GGDEF)-like protein/PAS domain S-box-containing protein